MINLKVWIIYKDGIGFLKIIAEMLQDRFDEYIDVSVGNAIKINPSFLVEESLHYLIIGDLINNEIPSLEIQNWLLKYCEISCKLNLNLKAISVFYVTSTSTQTSVQPLWARFLKDNVKANIVFPPLLHLKLNLVNLSLENGTIDLIKKYTDDFIEFFVNNEKMNEE
ncbi:MAG: hypothetical protein P8Y70_14015 [Candidatus Lokiarchaeota archaeon]